MVSISSRSDDYKLDDTDKKILNILQESYKITFKQIGEKIGMAGSSVHNRVQNMIDTGIIEKEGTIVNPFKVGYRTTALVGLSVDPLKMNDIAETLASEDQIQMVGTTTGDHDLIIRVIAENEKELWRFINKKVKTVKGVKSNMDVSSFIDFFKISRKIKFNTE